MVAADGRDQVMSKCPSLVTVQERSIEEVTLSGPSAIVVLPSTNVIGSSGIRTAKNTVVDVDTYLWHTDYSYKYLQKNFLHEALTRPAPIIVARDSFPVKTRSRDESCATV